MVSSNCYFCNKEEGIKQCTDCTIFSCTHHLSYHSRGGTCGAWCVKTVPGAGRGLFANRNIQAGDVVVQDWAIVEGPLPGLNQVCLVCLRDDDCNLCVECRLPVCKSRTRGCPSRHKAECKILKDGSEQNLSKDCLYTSIASIRLMWGAERDPTIRELLDPLMDHREIHDQGINSGWDDVVNFLSKHGFDRENIVRTMGLLQTNGVTSSSVGGEGRGHSLYPIFSIVNNSCVSNTRHGRKDDSFCLIATVDINMGDEITTNYKSPTLGNIARQPAFKSLWNFQCTCARCIDPTELGTYSSSLLCPDCTSPIIQESTDLELDWCCSNSKCAKPFSFQFISEKTSKLNSLVQTTGHGVEKLENLVEILSRVVYKHHCLLMQVKRMLLLQYGNCASHRWETLTSKDIKRKIELCREYIEVYTILEPGLTKWKGRVCEELARALVHQDKVAGVEVCRLIGEAGKCRQLDSQEERAAFNMRVAHLMSQ
ncbi:protein msta isoform X2 [Eurytemora carolleeae]|uniref:protein msta isoform X2 n=1 Tax=Eurytemora carolleeae TaxID=1294199 RepID=UPI000C78DA81|nr:protein msta isoform X2 [Eurytemora carolleeae]|eukprot:XP_023330630.1 protein msta-like isoform X2 [Eurytemora affinis]